MEKFKLTKQEARNYLVNRSFLHHKSQSLHEVLSYYRCVQVDPISTFGRNHELVLWNRVEGFKRSDLAKELYANRTLFEYWLQLYSIIPTEYFPYFKPVMKKELGGWRLDYFHEHKEQIDQVLTYLAQNKAISSKDLNHVAPGKSIFDWKGKASQKALLEYLWDTGEIMISGRRANHKLFDITSDILDPKLLQQETTFDQSVQFHLESSFYYIGLLRRSFLSRHRRYIIKEIRDLFNMYLRDGRVVEVEVEDSGQRYFVLRQQIAEIEKYKHQQLHQVLSILPPLDPLVIDRDLIEDLFDFFYRWEAYVPPIKRAFGYYGMPVLYRGELIGQVQLELLEGKFKVAKLQSKIPTELLMDQLNIKVAELTAFLST